jgi:DNA adenine methylase
LGGDALTCRIRVGIASRPRSTGPLLSCLRYPGGKRRLASYIERVFALNELRPAWFIEPFAGGASVSLHLLQRGLVERVVLADRDPLVSALWATVFDRAGNEWLIDQVMRVPVTLERWHAFRRRMPRSIRGRALACLFLNRTSFSGILHDKAGPIGGQRQKSAYAIDCRFPRETIARRIREAAAYRKQVRVWHGSWERTLARVRRLQGASRIAGSVCYYLDPPFFEKADQLYRFCFADRDHEALRDAVLTMQESWIVSYDVAPPLEALWGSAGWQAHIELLYSMPQRIAREAILSNLDLPGPASSRARSSGRFDEPPVVPWIPVNQRSLARTASRG